MGENPAGEAPGSGHRGFELHGQVVVDQDRPDLDPVQNHVVNVKGLGRSRASHPVVTDAAQWDGVYEALEK